MYENICSECEWRGSEVFKEERIERPRAKSEKQNVAVFFFTGQAAGRGSALRVRARSTFLCRCRSTPPLGAAIAPSTEGPLMGAPFATCSGGPSRRVQAVRAKRNNPTRRGEGRACGPSQKHVGAVLCCGLRESKWSTKSCREIAHLRGMAWRRRLHSPGCPSVLPAERALNPPPAHATPLPSPPQTPALASRRHLPARRHRLAGPRSQGEAASGDERNDTTAVGPSTHPRGSGQQGGPIGRERNSVEAQGRVCMVSLSSEHTQLKVE